MNTGYDYAMAYANWVSRNQRQVAQARLGDSLSKLCARKFQIPISEESLENWSRVTSMMLYELLMTEESSEDIFDVTLPLRKKDIICKYMGDKTADAFEDQFSLHYDAYQILARMQTLVRMSASRN